jgi:hypothetical protein
MKLGIDSGREGERERKWARWMSYFNNKQGAFQGCSAFDAAVVYGFNANGMVRESRERARGERAENHIKMTHRVMVEIGGDLVYRTERRMAGVDEQESRRISK